MNYERNWVLAAYRAEFDTRRNPSAKTLADYDQLLFDEYEQEIQGQADPAIPLNPFTRSLLMYFATRSEAMTPATRVRHAYEFFRNTTPVP